MKQISTDRAPYAVGPYSQGIVVDDLLFTSGQIGLSPVSNTIEASDIEGQTRQVMENLQAVLEAAGTSFANVVKTTCYLKDMNDFEAFNNIYGVYFESLPARSCVEVSSLPKGALVEVELVAMIKEDSLRTF